ncbi:MAG: hypothetical protein ACLTCB_08395 [Merdibacter sp.]
MGARGGATLPAVLVIESVMFAFQCSCIAFVCFIELYILLLIGYVYLFSVKLRLFCFLNLGAQRFRKIVTSALQ